MRDYRYTLEEDRFIIENCEKMTYAEMAYQIGRPSIDSIRQRVKILERLGKLKRFGVVRDGVFHRFYSNKEDEIIEKLYPSLGKKALAKKLKRPESSIRYRAAKLNVKPGPPAHFNPIRVAQLLGVCQRIVLDWVYQGFLKADNRNGRRVGRHREWIIKPKNFHKFLKDYYYLYDPSRVKDKSLLAVIASTPAAKVVTTSQASKILGIVEQAVIRRAINGKFPVVYKGFGPSGHGRWYVQLGDSVFEWFRNLVDDINKKDSAAGWLVEIARLRNPGSIEYLNVLLRYEPERVKQLCRMIKARAPVANRIVREFEATPEGEKLRSLTE